MEEKHPLLSNFLEELKVQYNGSNLNKHISIFYNDWSLNPYDEDDYSERVGIAGDVLNTFNLHLTQRIHDVQEKETDTEEEYNDDLREIDNLEYLQEQIVLVLNELTKLGYAK